MSCEKLQVFRGRGKREDGVLRRLSRSPGLLFPGKTLEEALRSIREAIKVHLEDRMSDDEEIPQPEPVSFTRLDVSF